MLSKKVFFLTALILYLVLGSATAFVESGRAFHESKAQLDLLTPEQLKNHSEFQHYLSQANKFESGLRAMELAFDQMQSDTANEEAIRALDNCSSWNHPFCQILQRFL